MITSLLWNVSKTGYAYGIGTPDFFALIVEPLSEGLQLLDVLIGDATTI
jgi:hypothetical protein